VPSPMKSKLKVDDIVEEDQLYESENEELLVSTIEDEKYRKYFLSNYDDLLEILEKMAAERV
jgi:hypothetical protein